MQDVSFDQSMASIYEKDPAFAVEIIDSLLEDGEAGEMRSFLRQLTRAFGGVEGATEVAENATPDSLKGHLRGMRLHIEENRVTAV